MRALIVTMVPMLAAAAFVVVGGERLARQQVAEPLPADHERLLEFAEEFERELDRLDALYLSYLDRIAAAFGPDHPADLESQARAIPTLRSIHYWTLAEDHDELVLMSAPSHERLPELVLDGHDRPLNSSNAIVLPRDLLESEPGGARGWQRAPRPDHRVFWARPAPDRLVAFVISWRQLQMQLRSHLHVWTGEPLTPLREAGERLAIQTPSGHLLTSTGDTRRGPTALLMPIRTTFGDWQLQAWDGVQVRTEHDPAALALAGTLAAILALGGLVLFLQQRRALRLAEERVSFVNRVSHELGAPLTNVALNLDLAGEAVDASPSETRRRLAIVTEEVERLARLVANVLTFSRRDRRTLELDPQPCTPDQVIGKTLDSFRPALRRRGLEIDWQANAGNRVLLDPDALGQIVGNLVSNVEKYAADGGWLGIASAFHDGTLVVTVADRGPGIPARSRERIFHPFERVHRNVNEGASGTGLGLTIARELAQRMGGTLELLESDRGTRFALRVPAPPVLAVVKDDESSAA